MSNLEPYKGVRDFYPEDKAQQTALFAIVREVLAKQGYVEYDASPLERAELYEAKTSEEIVSEQTYTFTDRGDRRVTLRPEMTPTLARMIAARRRELPLPIRWYAIGNRFRYERPQKGRLREFYQIDVDLLGVPHTAADIELMLLARRILHAFGAGDETFRIHINSRTLLSAACAASDLSDEQQRAYLRLLDKRNKLSREDFDAAAKDILGDATDPLTHITENTHEAVVAARTEIDIIITTLKEMGATNAVFDPTLTRGFDYYTGPVFEIFDIDTENSRSLFGGGRYDHLIETLGGESLPAAGFAVGDVTLVDFLTHHDCLPAVDFAPHIYLATPSLDALPEARAFADQLREEGLSIFTNLLDRKIGDQIKDADRRSIPYVIVYGPEEAKSKHVTIRDITTGDEYSVAKDRIVEMISAQL